MVDKGATGEAVSAMAATHPVIRCTERLQEWYPEHLRRRRGRSKNGDLLGKAIRSVTLETSEAANKHGGVPVRRPLIAKGAQMSAAYVAALQLVDGRVVLA